MVALWEIVSSPVFTLYLGLALGIWAQRWYDGSEDD